MMREMLLRVALLALAVLALGWLAVLYRDNRIVDDVSPGLIGNARLSAQEFEREARRLDRAALLNPDPTWRLNLGLALIERDPRRAVRELGRVVESEPDNVTAWKILRVAARRVDRHLAARAQAEVKRLDPLTEP
jgi:predicted Zn-dependent protease